MLEAETATCKKAIFEGSLGPGLITLTDAVSALAIFAAGTTAETCELETNVVASGAPFRFTVAPEIKPVPRTVKVNCGPPGATAAGSSGWSIKGTGFCASAELKAPRKQSSKSAPNGLRIVRIAVCIARRILKLQIVFGMGADSTRKCLRRATRNAIKNSSVGFRITKSVRELRVEDWAKIAGCRPIMLTDVSGFPPKHSYV